MATIKIKMERILELTVTKMMAKQTNNKMEPVAITVVVERKLKNENVIIVESLGISRKIALNLQAWIFVR